MGACEEVTEVEGLVGSGTEELSDDSGLGLVDRTDDGMLVELTNLGVDRPDEVEGSTEGVEGRSEDGPTLWVEPTELAIEVVLGSGLGVVVVLPTTHELGSRIEIETGRHPAGNAAGEAT